MHSQLIKTTDAGGPRGYDLGKGIKRRKHHFVLELKMTNLV
jgi:hypothetical protein